MSIINCTLKSPVHIQEKTDFTIPPIVFSNRLYIINDKKLIDLLAKINLFKDFEENIKEKGYEFTAKWLNNKGLMNQGFLENVSQYWISNVNIRKLTNYQTFLKDINNNPTISTSYIRDLFKKTLLYNYIRGRRDEFNVFVEKELSYLKKELSSINDIKDYNVRQNNYRKRFFKFILENFLMHIDEKLANDLQTIENITISLETLLNVGDLVIHRVGSIDTYKKSNFQVANITQQECLKKDINVKIMLSFNSNFQDVSDLKTNILNKITTFAQDKANFDSKYISWLYSRDNTGDYDKNSPPNKEKLLKYYSSISNYNMLMYSNEEFNKLIVVLNMNESNINLLNELIYSKNSRVEGDMVKVIVGKGNEILSPIGFVNIDY